MGHCMGLFQGLGIGGVQSLDVRVQRDVLDNQDPPRARKKMWRMSRMWRMWRIHQNCLHWRHILACHEGRKKQKKRQGRLSNRH